MEKPAVSEAGAETGSKHHCSSGDLLLAHARENVLSRRKSISPCERRSNAQTELRVIEILEVVEILESMEVMEVVEITEILNVQQFF
jgi:hypothetical protein